MAVAPIDPTAQTPAAAAAANVSAQAAERQKVAELAHQFEAMLIGQMLKAMRQSMLDDEKGQGLGAETMTDAFDGELASALSKAGGFGLSQQLLQALEREQAGGSGGSGGSGGAGGAGGVGGAGGAGGVSIPASFPVPAPAAAPAAPAAAPGGVPDLPPLSVDQVTSAFGWRTDPIDGRTRFHAGTDLRAAYGQQVDAVASGRVAFSGEQSGYGLTVVIDHGHGLQTRYAHLSAASVQAGDVVESGEVVGRTGSSGRATGPHLHFEVRQNGRPIDPASLLKQTQTVADSTTYKSDH